jgi:ribonuclease HII
MARGRLVRELGSPDRVARQQGYRRVCGLDEVGRGPLAGPVVAAAVTFAGGVDIPGLGDSKQLTRSARARLVPVIRRVATGVGLGLATPEEIDRINILQASLLAMVRAVTALPWEPDFLLVDGVHTVPLSIPQQTLIGGDARSTAVAAASVLAKEHRDALMVDYADAYPGYGFERHKGYPTLAHRDALRRLGPSPIHRTSFKGVQEPCHAPVQPDLFPAGERT